MPRLGEVLKYKCAGVAALHRRAEGCHCSLPHVPFIILKPGGDGCDCVGVAALYRGAESSHCRLPHASVTVLKPGFRMIWSSFPPWRKSSHKSWQYITCARYLGGMAV